MEQYYNNRAKEYEKIYHRDDPVRQQEQNEIISILRTIFQNKTVFEIACGTGYWTKYISEVSKKIIAIDISEEMISIAKEKQLKNVLFYKAGAFNLTEIKENFDAGCANFWFSHIPKNKINEFIDSFHKKLSDESIVFMADNIYISGIGGELITQKGDENTYKLRRLESGEEYKIIKNYYNFEQLQNIFQDKIDNLEIHIGKCFWWVKYNVKN